MKNRTTINMILVLSVFLMNTDISYGQFSWNGQMIERGEYRHGYGTTISADADPAVFIGQRLRLEGQLKLNRLTFYAGLQDVRTWGNTSQLNISDDSFSMHEGWADIRLDSNFSVKLGRQELVYDHSRFLGNVDWALQGRSHDFVLLKFRKNNTRFDLGAGYNQNGEALSGNLYTVAGQYKTAQMIWFEQKWQNLNVSFLFWNNGKQFVVRDSLEQIKSQGVRFMQTIGLPAVRYQKGNAEVITFLYWQTGKDVADKNVSAIDAGVQFSYLLKFNEQKGTKLKLAVGGEYLSGNSQKSTGNVNHAYSPLFGTNHTYNGYMDYFYVGGRHENSVGLTDGQLIMKYDISKKMFVLANLHCFMANGDIYKDDKKLDAFLGTEFDFTAGYILDKSISFQLGYSHFADTETLQFLRKQPNASGVQNWGYLMVIIRPDSDKRFIGLLQ